jgi:hypothetical protein
MAGMTTWWLMLGAIALLAPNVPGDGGDMATDEKAPETVAAAAPRAKDFAQTRVAAFLRDEGTDPSRCAIQRVGLRFPGYTFVSVSCEPEHRAVDHGLPDRPMVVRDDGTICQGKAEDEVARFLASLGLPDAAPAEALHQVARAVLFFAGDPAMVLEAQDVAGWMKNRKGADLAEPSLATRGGVATLTFWAQVAASGRQPPTFKRFEVRMDAKGRVRIKQKTFRTSSR